MINFPISLKRKFYSGKTQSKKQEISRYNDLIKKIETHVNKIIATHIGDCVQVWSHEVASDLNLDRGFVEDALYEVNCSFHGFTINKKNNRISGYLHPLEDAARI